jgi:hypothetical protein
MWHLIHAVDSKRGIKPLSEYRRESAFVLHFSSFSGLAVHRSIHHCPFFFLFSFVIQICSTYQYSCHFISSFFSSSLFSIYFYLLNFSSIHVYVFHNFHNEGLITKCCVMNSRRIRCADHEARMWRMRNWNTILIKSLK